MKNNCERCTYYSMPYYNCNYPENKDADGYLRKATVINAEGSCTWYKINIKIAIDEWFDKFKSYFKREG